MINPLSTTSAMARTLHRRKRQRAVRPASGSAPGVLRPGSDALNSTLACVLYDEGSLAESTVSSVADIPQRGPKTLWLDIRGLAGTEVIRGVAERYGLHPLTLSDIVHTHQRPKTEIYDDYVVVILRMPHGGLPFESEQVTFVVGDGFLLTFQERPGDCFDPVRERLRAGGKRIRGAGAPYLAYALIDALIDAYFPILERYGDLTEDLEVRVIETPDSRLIADIHLLKRELLDIRRAIWPQREAVNVLLRDETTVFPAEVKTYLRDCADHSFQLIDMVEIYREVAQGLVDLHLSSVSNRMNEVMKVLTIIATIFIPMSFVAGVYGMNFDRASPWNLPELGWRFGYLFSLVLMASIAGGMLFMFWRKGWILPRQHQDGGAAFRRPAPGAGSSPDSPRKGPQR